MTDRLLVEALTLRVGWENCCLAWGEFPVPHF